MREVLTNPVTVSADLESVTAGLSAGPSSIKNGGTTCSRIGFCDHFYFEVKMKNILYVMNMLGHLGATDLGSVRGASGPQGHFRPACLVRRCFL